VLVIWCGKFKKMLEDQPVLPSKQSIAAENAVSVPSTFMLFASFQDRGLTQDAISYKEVRKTYILYLFRPRRQETIQGEEDVDPSLVNLIIRLNRNQR
jgi:hypothetical protein